jgi:hypothetical protein
MTRSRDFDRMTRAWLDLMPDEVPDRVIANVLQAVETTPQVRRPFDAAFRRSFQMNRFSLAAAAAVAVVVLAGGALLLSRSSPSDVGRSSSSPVTSTGPVPSTASVLPPELVGTWLGAGTSGAAPATAAGTALTLSAAALAVTPANLQTQPLLRAAVTIAGGTLQVVDAKGTSSGCGPTDVGTYAFSLSASDQTLTIRQGLDPCAARAAALPGSWWLADCRNVNPPSCLGTIDAGTYDSEYFASVGSPSGAWKPRFGALSYTVPDGWANDADSPMGYSLAPATDYLAAGPGSDPATGIDLLSNALPESQASACSGKTASGVAPGAAGFIAWLRGIRDLEVSATTPISIHGHAALSVDVTLPTAPATLCGGTDAVVEYLYSPGWPTEGSSPIEPEAHAILAGGRERLILLDSGSGLIAIVIHVHDATAFDAFISSAMPIVDSLSFVDAFPGG